MQRKRKRWIFNIALLLVGLFFASRLFSSIQLARAGKRSQEIYAAMAKESLAGADPSPAKEAQEDELTPRSQGETSQLPKRDFRAIQEDYPDVRGWITGLEGRVDYPLVQAKDNAYYLNTAANGEKNILGAIFLDYRNASLEDPMVLIYGHMMKNGQMFGSLKALKKADRKPQAFTLETEENRVQAQVVLTKLMPGETILDPRDFTTFDRLQAFYGQMQEDALYDAYYELQEGDRLVILVTCSFEAENLRLLVVTVVKDAETVANR